MQKVNQEIDVAAFFSQGEIRPIKFKFTGQDEEEIEAKVNKLIGRKVVKTKEKSYVDFLCRSIFDNIEEEYILRFKSREITWLLHKK